MPGVSSMWTCLSAICITLLLANQSNGQNQIVLRNLEVIESVNLEFDKNRIQADTKTIYWDEVLSASAPNDQAQFDQHLREIGTPLFRFCHRLKIKDYGLTFLLST